MAKQYIYLTDITFHARKLSPANSFAKVADRGRMYLPPSIKLLENGDFTLAVTLPEDLLEKIQKGEITLMTPKDGPDMILGRDGIEKARKLEKTKRNEIIHNNRNNTWHEGDMEVR